VVQPDLNLGAASGKAHRGGIVALSQRLAAVPVEGGMAGVRS